MNPANADRFLAFIDGTLNDEIANIEGNDPQALNSESTRHALNDKMVRKFHEWLANPPPSTPELPRMDSYASSFVSHEALSRSESFSSMAGEARQNSFAAHQATHGPETPLRRRMPSLFGSRSSSTWSNSSVPVSSQIQRLQTPFTPDDTEYTEVFVPPPRPAPPPPPRPAPASSSIAIPARVMPGFKSFRRPGLPPVPPPPEPAAPLPEPAAPPKPRPRFLSNKPQAAPVRAKKTPKQPKAQRKPPRSHKKKLVIRTLNLLHAEHLDKGIRQGRPYAGVIAPDFGKITYMQQGSADTIYHNVKDQKKLMQRIKANSKLMECFSFTKNPTTRIYLACEKIMDLGRIRKTFDERTQFCIEFMIEHRMFTTKKHHTQANLVLLMIAVIGKVAECKLRFKREESLTQRRGVFFNTDRLFFLLKCVDEKMVKLVKNGSNTRYSWLNTLSNAKRTRVIGLVDIKDEVEISYHGIFKSEQHFPSGGSIYGSTDYVLEQMQKEGAGLFTGDLEDDAEAEDASSQEEDPDPASDVDESSDSSDGGLNKACRLAAKRNSRKRTRGKTSDDDSDDDSDEEGEEYDEEGDDDDDEDDDDDDEDDDDDDDDDSAGDED